MVCKLSFEHSLRNREPQIRLFGGRKYAKLGKSGMTVKLGCYVSNRENEKAPFLLTHFKILTKVKLLSRASFRTLKIACQYHSIPES